MALESRAEIAEMETEAAAESMAVMTPQTPWPALAAEQLLGPEGLAALQAAALQDRQADCADQASSSMQVASRAQQPPVLSTSCSGSSSCSRDKHATNAFRSALSVVMF